MARKRISHLLPICALLITLMLSACSSQIPAADAPGFAAPTARPATQAPSSSDTSTAGPSARDWGDSVTWLASDPYADTGIQLDTGGDVDTEAVSVGNPPVQAQRTGNEQVMPADDGNETEDSFMQFSIDDAFMSRGSPTSLVRIEVEYLDQGTDWFSIHYDASGEGGPFGDGRFMETAFVIKTDSGEFRTIEFLLRDAFFANRDNGGDFRIADNNDGPETIRRVTVTLVLPSSDPQAPLYIDFYDDGNYLVSGQCTSLHWTVQNATEINLDGDQVDSQDYRYLCPQSTTTYVLQAQNEVEEKQEAITVVVVPPSIAQPGPLPEPVLEYDFSVFCEHYSPDRIKFLIYFAAQPGQISGLYSYVLSAGVDLGNFQFVEEYFGSGLQNGQAFELSGIFTDEYRCCQVYLTDNDDVNPSNDFYETCW